jgi:hypothetical protein
MSYFDDLMEGLQDAIAHARGKKTLRTTLVVRVPQYVVDDGQVQEYLKAAAEERGLDFNRAMLRAL